MDYAQIVQRTTTCVKKSNELLQFLLNELFINEKFESTEYVDDGNDIR